MSRSTTTGLLLAMVAAIALWSVAAPVGDGPVGDGPAPIDQRDGSRPASATASVAELPAAPPPTRTPGGVDAPDDEQDLVTITGVVTTYDGAPIEHATVRCAGAKTTSAADGRFALTLERPWGGQLRVSCTKPGFVDGRDNRTLTVGDRATVTLRMGRPHRLRVRLVDRDTGAVIPNGRLVGEEMVPRDDGELLVDAGEGAALRASFGAPDYCDTEWRLDAAAP